MSTRPRPRQSPSIGGRRAGSRPPQVRLRTVRDFLGWRVAQRASRPPWQRLWPGGEQAEWRFSCDRCVCPEVFTAGLHTLLTVTASDKLSPCRPCGQTRPSPNLGGLACSSLCFACPELRFLLSLPQFTPLFRLINPANIMKHHLSLLSTTSWSHDLTRPLKCDQWPLPLPGPTLPMEEGTGPPGLPHRGPGPRGSERVDGTPAPTAEALSRGCRCRDLGGPACHFPNAAPGRWSPLSPRSLVLWLRHVVTPAARPRLLNLPENPLQWPGVRPADPPARRDPAGRQRTPRGLRWGGVSPLPGHEDSSQPTRSVPGYMWPAPDPAG